MADLPCNTPAWRRDWNPPQIEITADAVSATWRMKLQSASDQTYVGWAAPMMRISNGGQSLNES